jgi:hypothetical protein
MLMLGLGLGLRLTTEKATNKGTAVFERGTSE